MDKKSKPSVRPLVLLALNAILAGCAASSPQPSAVTVTMQASQTVATGVGTAAQAPLRDLNVNQKSIPPVLARAKAAPYDLKDLTDCGTIAAAVRELDLALGPDIDLPKPADQRSDLSKGAAFATEAGVEALTSAAEGVIPLRSIVRKMSGAEKKTEMVRASLLAGFVRRAYLKGVSLKSNCPPLAPMPPPGPTTPPPTSPPQASHE